MSTKSLAYPTTETEPALDMSSMIDVSFLLLIFFLLTSTLDPKEADLGMALPGDKMDPGGEPLPVDPMHIRIDSSGTIHVYEDTLDTDINRRELPLLEDKLAQYKAATDLMSSLPLVFVEADDAVPGQRFVDVLNALAKVKIKNVTIADVAKQ